MVIIFQLIILLILSLLLVIGVIFVIFQIVTLVAGAPYLGSSHQRIKTMLEIAHIKKGDRVVDLGSGDGRIVIEMAKVGADAHGYEVNPFFVMWARYNIWRNHVSNASIHWRNFWKEDLTSYDVVTVYGIPYMMDKLEEKMRRELKVGGRFVSNGMPFKNWKPKQEKDYIFLYKK